MAEEQQVGEVAEEGRLLLLPGLRCAARGRARWSRPPWCVGPTQKACRTFLGSSLPLGGLQPARRRRTGTALLLLLLLLPRPPTMTKTT